MKVYDLIWLVSLILVLVDFYRNRKIGFGKWLFELGFFKYFLKSIILILSYAYIMYKLIYKVDWSFLTLKLW